MKEVRQCSSCGGFCKKSGCERENVKPEPSKAELMAGISLQLREIERLREQLTLAETVRTSQVAGLVEGAEKLRERVARLEDALTHISLCSQSSMSGKEECGRIARAALKGKQ